VKKYGLRNGYITAVAPTGSTSNIAGTTAGIDPIFKKFFIEEKKGSFTPKAAPDLSDENFWLYKEAHHIDQLYSIKACGIRQRHIDQSQSFNLYITPEVSAKDILNLYMEAWRNGVKTIYYVRNQSLEMDECTSCSS
jgi:ribonucleoside-diphosphate reductase alpha chain